MAAIAVTVTLPAVPLLQGDQAQKLLRLEVGTAVTGVVEDIASHARENVHVGVSGILRASIGTRVTAGVDASTLVLGEVFTGQEAPYAEAVERGSRPHWPPRAPIELWAQRVLGDATLWFLVARAISRRGTPPQWFMRNALAAVEPTILPRVQSGVDRAAARMTGSA